MGVDAAHPAKAVTGVVLLQRLKRRVDAAVALAGQRRVDELSVVCPGAGDQLTAPVAVRLAPGGEVGVDGGGEVCRVSCHGARLPQHGLRTMTSEVMAGER